MLRGALRQEQWALVAYLEAVTYLVPQFISDKDSRQALAAIADVIEREAGTIEETPPPSEGDDGDSVEHGVAPRNLWFLQQHGARGTDTYHSPKRIHAKWDGMKERERAAICPMRRQGFGRCR